MVSALNALGQMRLAPDLWLAAAEPLSNEADAYRSALRQEASHAVVRVNPPLVLPASDYERIVQRLEALYFVGDRRSFFASSVVDARKAHLEARYFDEAQYWKHAEGSAQSLRSLNKVQRDELQVLARQLKQLARSRGRASSGAVSVAPPERGLDLLARVAGRPSVLVDEGWETIERFRDGARAGCGFDSDVEAAREALARGAFDKAVAHLEQAAGSVNRLRSLGHAQRNLLGEELQAQILRIRQVQRLEEPPGSPLESWSEATINLAAPATRDESLRRDLKGWQAGPG